MAKLEGVKVIDMVGGEVTKIAYEGEEYAKVDGVGKAGDIGLRNCNDVPWARIGEYFEMKRVGNWLRYYDNHGDTPAVNQNQWAFFRKTSAQPTLTDRVETLESKVAALEEGGKQADVFVKIDRKPRVGDYVVFTKSSDSDITVGKYYEITGFDSHGDPRFIDDAGEGNVQGYYEEVEYFEKVTDTPTQVISGDPQVGDKIRIVDAYSPLGTYTNGDTFTVERVGTAYGPDSVEVEEHDRVIARYEFEIISRPEKAEEPALKVGDFAKVVNATLPFSKVGQIVIISEDDESGIPYKTESLGGEYTGWHYKDDLVKATDEEVAEAKRKLAEEQKAEAEAKKWVEIGRKPNEFKKGDIVRLTCPVGIFIGEVREEPYGNSVPFRHYGDKFGNTTESVANITLITPVEHRFDK